MTLRSEFLQVATHSSGKLVIRESDLGTELEKLEAWRVVDDGRMLGPKSVSVWLKFIPKFEFTEKFLEQYGN